MSNTRNENTVEEQTSIGHDIFKRDVYPYLLDCIKASKSAYQINETQVLAPTDADTTDEEKSSESVLSNEFSHELVSPIEQTSILGDSWDEFDLTEYRTHETHASHHEIAKRTRIFVKSNVDEKLLIIAFRGTQLSIIDFRSDLNIAFGEAPKLAKKAKNLLIAVGILETYSDHAIYYTGHSLGGAIAEHLAIKDDSQKSTAITFDSPGVHIKASNRHNTTRVFSFSEEPNLVNTSGTHYGSLFRIKLEGESTHISETIFNEAVKYLGRNAEGSFKNLLSQPCALAIKLLKETLVMTNVALMGPQSLQKTQKIHEFIENQANIAKKGIETEIRLIWDTIKVSLQMSRMTERFLRTLMSHSLDRFVVGIESLYETLLDKIHTIDLPSYLQGLLWHLEGHRWPSCGDYYGCTDKKADKQLLRQVLGDDIQVNARSFDMSIDEAYEPLYEQTVFDCFAPCVQLTKHAYQEVSHINGEEKIETSSVQEPGLVDWEEVSLGQNDEEADIETLSIQEPGLVDWEVVSLSQYYDDEQYGEIATSLRIIKKDSYVVIAIRGSILPILKGVTLEESPTIMDGVRGFFTKKSKNNNHQANLASNYHTTSSQQRSLKPVDRAKAICAFLIEAGVLGEGEYSDRQFIFTGHAMGGSIAQYMTVFSSNANSKAIVFDSTGVDIDYFGNDYDRTRIVEFLGKPNLINTTAAHIGALYLTKFTGKDERWYNTIFKLHTAVGHSVEVSKKLLGFAAVVGDKLIYEGLQAYAPTYLNDIQYTQVQNEQINQAFNLLERKNESIFNLLKTILGVMGKNVFSQKITNTEDSSRIDFFSSTLVDLKTNMSSAYFQKDTLIRYLPRVQSWPSYDMYIRTHPSQEDDLLEAIKLGQLSEFNPDDYQDRSLLNTELSLNEEQWTIAVATPNAKSDLKEVWIEAFDKVARSIVIYRAHLVKLQENASGSSSSYWANFNIFNEARYRLKYACLDYENKIMNYLQHRSFEVYPISREKAEQVIAKFSELQTSGATLSLTWGKHFVDHVNSNANILLHENEVEEVDEEKRNQPVGESSSESINLS